MHFALGSGEQKRDLLQYLVTLVAVYFTFYVSSTLAGYLLAWITESGAREVPGWITFAVQLLPFTVGLGVLVWFVKFVHNQPFLSVITARSSFDFKRFLVAAGLWLLISMVFLYSAIASGLPVVFRWNPSEQIPLLIVCLILLPIQTAAEDILFRGYLFQGLARSTGIVWLSIVIIALFFGLIHMGNPEVDTLGPWILPLYIVPGLFMGILAHLDDGLELGMGYHFANNFFGAMIVTNNWQVFQTDAFFLDRSEASVGLADLIPLLIIQPLLLFVFYKIYRWKDPLKRLTE